MEESVNTIMTTTKSSIVMGIVLRAYLLTSRRVRRTYLMDHSTNTSCMGASANFSANKTAMRTISLVGQAINSSVGMGTSNNVRALRSTQGVFCTNTSHVKSDSNITVTRTRVSRVRAV